jgi:hypothetical protein
LAPTLAFVVLICWHKHVLFFKALQPIPSCHLQQAGAVCHDQPHCDYRGQNLAEKTIASPRQECLEDTEDESIEEEAPTGTRTGVLDSRLLDDSDDDFTVAQSPFRNHNRHQVCMKTLLRIVCVLKVTCCSSA